MRVLILEDDEKYKNIYLTFFNKMYIDSKVLFIKNCSFYLISIMFPDIKKFDEVKVLYEKIYNK